MRRAFTVAFLILLSTHLHAAINNPKVQVVSSTPSLPAGATGTATYSVTNQSTVTRTYTLQGISLRPEIVHDPADPPSITLAAGEVRQVSLTYQVSPTAPAGSTATVRLKAIDAQDATKSHYNGFLHTTAAANPNPTVSLPDGWQYGLRGQSYSVRLVVKNNATQTRTLCFTSRRAPGASGDPNNVTTSDPTVPACQSFTAGQTKTLQAGYTMANGDWDGDAVIAYITAYDQQDPSRTAEASFKIVVLMASQAPAAATLEPGQTYVHTFGFFNQDRFGSTRTYNVSHSTTSTAIFGNASRPSTITIPAGTWGYVNVTFTTGSNTGGQSGSLTVSLQDTDPNWPDRRGTATSTVNVADVVAPSVALPDGWRHGLRGQSYSVRLVVTNNTPAIRTLCFTSRRSPGYGGNVDNVTAGDPAVPPCQTFGAGETKTLQAGYTMAHSDWDGDNVLAYITAYDQLQPARWAEAWFKISVSMNAQAPAAATLQAGQTHTQTFRFFNQDRFGISHTYNVSHSIAGSDLFHGINYPPTVAIAAGAWADVNVTFTVPAGSNGQSGALTMRLQDVDPNWPERIGTATSQVTSGNAPPPVPPGKFNAYSLFRTNFDHPKGIPIQLAGGHFDARQYRQWVGWVGCAPNWFPNGDPDIAYTEGVAQWAAQNPGKLWIFLDEPAHGTVWNHRAGNYTGCKQITPAQYARAYHAFVNSLRAADPTARVSPGGFEQRPASLEAYPQAFVQYAQEFRDAYRAEYGVDPPVDEWRFHVYWEDWPDPSDITGWRQKADIAIAFAQSHGAPVVLGIGYPWQPVFDPRMLDGMTNMFHYLKDHPLVSSVFWFSYDEFNEGFNRLTTYNGENTSERTLTALGICYRDLIAGLP